MAADAQFQGYWVRGQDAADREQMPGELNPNPSYNAGHNQALQFRPSAKSAAPAS